MKLYRYDDVQFAHWPGDDLGGGEVNLRIVLMDWHVRKETPSGYWIDGPRWVSKTSRKRFAHPSTEEAWRSFKARKRRQIGILSARLQRANRANSLPQPK